MSKTKTKAAKDAEEIGSSKELYNFLYEACNILRGPVSQDAFKEYITPLLYFKRISDVYDEETKAALEISDGDEEFAALPEQHRFVIPEGCYWDDVRQRTTDIGSAIRCLRNVAEEVCRHLKVTNLSYVCLLLTFHLF